MSGDNAGREGLRHDDDWGKELQGKPEGMLWCIEMKVG